MKRICLSFAVLALLGAARGARADDTAPVKDGVLPLCTPDESGAVNIYAGPGCMLPSGPGGAPVYNAAAAPVTDRQDSAAAARNETGAKGDKPRR